MNAPRVTAVIPAAGRGTRLDVPTPKAFMSLGNLPMLVQTLRPFERLPDVRDIVLVVPPGTEGWCRTALIRPFALRKIRRVVGGGRTRQLSVYRALQVVPRGTEIVVIHDAARPLVSERLIAATIRLAIRYGSAMAAVPVQDTVKQVGAGHRVVRTLDRTGLWSAQTPQAFRLSILREAHERARRAGITETDDAALVERAGHTVKVVPGSQTNLKITTPEDLILAERLLQGRVRVGLGYDVHPLRVGRRLVLGGVRIPYGKGLAGHSDADVLLHAIADALLGALGRGDLGRHYPSSDPRWKGASSLRLLQGIVEQMGAARVLHLDCVLMAERPRIASHVPLMRRRIAGVLRVPETVVNIKATTTEGLGFIGRGEGMAAEAVCTLSGPDPDQARPVRRRRQS